MLHRQLGKVDIAVVVVKDVFAPVRRAAHVVVFAGLIDLVAVIPVGVTVAAIGVGGGRDGNNQMVAYGVGDRAVFRDQSVSEFHQHFGRAGLTAMQPAH